MGIFEWYLSYFIFLVRLRWWGVRKWDHKNLYSSLSPFIFLVWYFEDFIKILTRITQIWGKLIFASFWSGKARGGIILSSSYRSTCSLAVQKYEDYILKTLVIEKEKESLRFHEQSSFNNKPPIEKKSFINMNLLLHPLKMIMGMKT